MLASFLLCAAASAVAQTSDDGVVDVPLSVPSQRSGVVPTSILPMGALRIESGGVRLPGQPAPQSAPVASAPAPSELTPGSAPPSGKPGRADPSARKGAAAPPSGCVGALDAPLQVQLGAVEGRAAAEKEVDRLMRRHGDLLGARPTPTDCAAKRTSMFRIRLAVPNPAEGQRLCNELSGRGERCIVMRGGQ